MGKKNAVGVRSVVLGTMTGEPRDAARGTSDTSRDRSPVAYLRFHPELRNDVLEHGGPKTIVTEQPKADFDASTLPVGLKIANGGLSTALRLVAEGDLEIVELTEPLWIRYWPKSLLIAVVTRAFGLIRGHRPRLVCHAIENLQPLERLTLPLLDQYPRVSKLLAYSTRPILALSLRVLDGISFGTKGAAEAYSSGFGGRGIGRVQTNLIEERQPTCARCTLVPWDERAITVVFVGELSSRKGVDCLIEAWLRVHDKRPTAELIVAGDGPLAAEFGLRTGNSGVQMLGIVGRDRVHEIMATARVVVLASRRVRRWREQVGLPLVEGEAHGARLVTTAESGISAALEARSSAIIVEAGDADDLADGIDRALGEGWSFAPSAVDSRDLVEDWYWTIR